MLQLDNVLLNFNTILNENRAKINSIIELPDKKLDLKTLSLFSKISENVQSLNDQIDEFMLLLLEKSDIEKTAEEKTKIREIRINNQVQELLMPLMIYTKLILENNN
uniref:Uncharacterized protein n=1 Tax=viral metagenome TaxID=1070528 RepID=A0A6C0J3L9_9ZZZZ